MAGLDSTNQTRFSRNLHYFSMITLEWNRNFRIAIDELSSARLFDGSNGFPEPAAEGGDTYITLPDACNQLFFKLIHLLKIDSSRNQILMILSRISFFAKLHLEGYLLSIGNLDDSVTIDLIMSYFSTIYHQLEKHQFSPSNLSDVTCRMQIVAFSFEVLMQFKDLAKVRNTYTGSNAIGNQGIGLHV